MFNPMCSTFQMWHNGCSHWSNFLYIPEGQYEVSSPGRPYRTNPEGVKNVPLGISILPVSSDDIPTQTLPSWCCGTLPAIANCHWLRSRANMTAWRNFDDVLDTQAVPHLDNHSPVAGPATCMHDGAMHVAHCEYQGPAAARRSESFGLAKQKLWFECNRKLVALNQTIIKQC